MGQYIYGILYTVVHNNMFRMNENMEFPGISGDDIEWLQEQFVKSIKVNFI